MNNSFLETVLPAQGTHYCAVAIDDKDKAIKWHDFVESVEQLEASSAKIVKNGYGAFVALATFQDRNRRADNAMFLRSFFVDLDVGHPVMGKDGKLRHKPYLEVHDAAKALRAFVEATKLPKPLIVASGGGIHAYWPFTEDVPYAKWKPAADAFKALCLAHKLGIDSQVTADGARVLRIPGTFNFKLDEPRPVQIVFNGGQTPFDELLKLLPIAPSVVDLSAAREFGVDDTTKAMAVGERKPSKFSTIAKRSLSGSGCGQMQHALVDASVLEEPLWRAALSIAWNCVDGEKAIHKLSAPHPEYTPENTLEKAQRTTNMPHTCQWYKENYPDYCNGCKHKITSPIQLGVFVAEAKEVAGEYVVEADLNPDSEDVQTHVEVHIPKYPFPYYRGKNGGVYKKQLDEHGNEIEPLEIYPQDLYITTRFYDSTQHGDGEGEIALINLHLPHDGIRRFHVPVTSLLAKDKMRDVLVKHGVVALQKQLDSIMAYLASSLRNLQANLASNKTRNQMGWTSDGTFVVGELEYTTAGVKLAPPASVTRALAPSFHSKGTLEEWSNIINFYDRPGMEAHAFGFLVGLGSPLLRLLNNTQVRGAVLNLVSNDSGTGKTTVQMAINSIFGHPVLLLMEAKDTPASRYARLGALNSICMTVDELTNANGEQLSALVYGSTSGRAPHRMEASTNKMRENQATWCSFTVTSSNAVMSDALSSHRTAVEGELKRVIDFTVLAPEDIPKAETDAHFSKLDSNYGVAGPIFIQHIVNNIESVENALKDMQLKIDNEAGFERNDRFYSAVCTAAFVAGLIGNKLGIFKLSLDRIYKYAVKALREVKEANRTTVGDAPTMALETLAAFINENVNNTLIIGRADTTTGLPAAPTSQVRNKLMMRYEPDSDELVISAADLRAYFTERRVDFKASLTAFRDMGALCEGKKPGEFAVVRRIAAGAAGGMVAPPTRCFVFKSKALGIEVGNGASAG